MQANAAMVSAAAMASAGINGGQLIPTSTSGVDSLIMAAMIEESAAALAMSNNNSYSYSNHYLPTGRGLAYPSYDLSSAAHNNYLFAAQQHHHQQQQQLQHHQQQIAAHSPRNKYELELHHLLERANLLNYYQTFISFGGDDVRQLSEADEDEFLEIMSLVGMTKKPLHVRRLQKALIEWRLRQGIMYQQQNQDGRDINNSGNTGLVED